MSHSERQHEEVQELDREQHEHISFSRKGGRGHVEQVELNSVGAAFIIWKTGAAPSKWASSSERQSIPECPVRGACPRVHKRRSSCQGPPPRARAIDCRRTTNFMDICVSLNILLHKLQKRSLACLRCQRRAPLHCSPLRYEFFFSHPPPAECYFHAGALCWARALRRSCISALRKNLVHAHSQERWNDNHECFSRKLERGILSRTYRCSLWRTAWLEEREENPYDAG